jgi:protein SCO1/2
LKRCKALLFFLVAYFCSLHGIASFADAGASKQYLEAISKLETTQGKFDPHRMGQKNGIFYFGFTNCLKKCPLAMVVLQGALRSMSFEQRSQFVPVFVSVDAEGDKARHASEFVAQFFENGIGLAGTEEALRGALDFFQTKVTRVQKSDLLVAPIFNHSAFFFIVGPSGKLMGQIYSEASSEQVKEQLLDFQPSR